MTRTVQEILARKRFAIVDGDKLELNAPQEKEANAIRTRMTSLESLDRDKPGSAGKMAEVSMECGIKAIAATAQCSRDEARQLFFLAGGEKSDLFSKAMKLCGLEYNLNAVEAEVTDPNS